jgi:hypothetical protein
MKKLMIISSLMHGVTALGDVSDKYFRPESLKKIILIERNISNVGRVNTLAPFWIALGLLLFTGLGLYLISRRSDSGFKLKTAATVEQTIIETKDSA